MTAVRALACALALVAASCAVRTNDPLLAGAELKRGEPGKAVDILRAAAEKGDVDSQKMLALMLELGVAAKEGVGVAANPREAFEWYEKAAQSGDKDAFKRLGILYAVGRGTPTDPEKALDSFRRGGFDVEGYLARAAAESRKPLSKSIEAWLIAYNVDIESRVRRYPLEAMRQRESGTVILQVDTATRAVEVVGGTAPDSLRGVVRETAARALIFVPPPEEAARSDFKTEITIDYRLY